MNKKLRFGIVATVVGVLLIAVRYYDMYSNNPIISGNYWQFNFYVLPALGLAVTVIGIAVLIVGYFDTHKVKQLKLEE